MSSVWAPVSAPIRSCVSTHTLAPFSKNFDSSTAVPKRIDKAFKAVLISSLRHWGQLDGWKVHPVIALSGDRQTQPDLCFGADPAGMLESGKIIVEDIRLHHTPKESYPDSSANDKYGKLSCHYAVLAIEKENRRLIHGAFEKFILWISDDSARIAYNDSGLETWRRIWTVISTRVGRGKQEESTNDDKMFSLCFEPFSDALRYVVGAGKKLSQDDIGTLRELLDSALDDYRVRKEVCIVHPGLISIADSEEKMFSDLSEDEKNDFGTIELTYSNIFSRWEHFLGRESSKPILQTLQFLLGMYLGVWDFNADKGMESDALNIIWADTTDEDVFFPLFLFAIEERLEKIKDWYVVNNDSLHINRVSRSLRVGPREGLVPSAENFTGFGYNASKYSYFNDANLEPLAKEAVRLFVRERERLNHGGLAGNNIDGAGIMEDVVRRLGLHELYPAKAGLNKAKRQKKEFFSFMFQNWPDNNRAFIQPWLKQGVDNVVESNHDESIFYGREIIRNEHIDKSRMLMLAVSSAVLEAETGKAESLRSIVLDQSASARAVFVEFCRFLIKRFRGQGAEQEVNVFINTYFRNDTELGFADIADAKKFIFDIGYMRDLLIADEKERTRKAQFKKFTSRINYKIRYLDSFGIDVDYDTGKVNAPGIPEDGEVSEISFLNFGTCIREYLATIKKITAETLEFSNLLGAFKTNKNELLAEPERMAAFADAVSAGKVLWPKNPLNITIHDNAVLLSGACRAEAPDMTDIALFADVLVNNLESRISELREMHYAFIERNFALQRVVKIKFEMIDELFGLIDRADDPLKRIQDRIIDIRKIAMVPHDIVACFRAVRDGLANGEDRDGAIVALDNYIHNSGLDALEGYFDEYQDYKSMLSRISDWAASYLKPRIEEAA